MIITLILLVIKERRLVEVKNLSIVSSLMQTVKELVLPTQGNRSPSFAVKTHILCKITFMFKNQSNYSGIWGQRVTYLSKL